VEGFFRDVRLWTIASGSSEMMREIIAKRLPL
jgi:alkylation response protein AidB-like acyl-CoA dehydrogenase